MFVKESSLVALVLGDQERLGAVSVSIDVDAPEETNETKERTKSARRLKDASTLLRGQKDDGKRART